MSGIYKPQGKAAEYSEYAVNPYGGCTHACDYCYVTPMMKRFNKDYDQSEVRLQKISQESIIRDCQKHANLDHQVLLSFTTDPYMNGFDTSMTSFILEQFLENRIPAAVLTKAPTNAVRDFPLMQKFGESLIMGTTITMLSNHSTIEPFADTPADRISAMAQAKDVGLITWISMEPAFSIEEGLAIIDATSEVVDRYRVGKLNHRHSDTDWTAYVQAIVAKLRSLDKSIFVKSDLAAFAPEGFLTPEECDPRRQDAKPFNTQSPHIPSSHKEFRYGYV